MTEVDCGRLIGDEQMPYWRFFYHLVWATKNRDPIIDDNAAIVIRQSLMLTSEDLDLIPHAIGVMPDHVHFAVSIPPKTAVSEVVRRLKGASSHSVNEERGMASPRFLWQPEYGAVTFGGRSLEQVINCVRDQHRHHAEQLYWSELEQIPD